MRLVSALVVLGLIAACTPQTKDQIARNAARSTINRVVLERYPNLPLEPAINCTIDNASADQIYALASESITGPTESSIQIVSQVVQKPQTVRCLATAYARAAGAI